MKNKALIIGIVVIVIAIAAICAIVINKGKGNEGNAVKGDSVSSVEVKEEKKDIPEGNFSDMGKGTFVLSTPSGTSENGNIPVIFMDESELAGKLYEMQVDLGISTNGFDGSKITNIYVDGFLQGKEQLADTGTSVAVSEKLSTVGKHKIELLQFDDNNNVVTYKSAEYEIKTK